MNENLKLWNNVAEVPKEAQKSITGGRLKGMTDINPMWRIKKLTEIFGMCGIGWKAPIKEKWLDVGATYTKNIDGQMQSITEVVANVEIELWVRDVESGEWCDAITGIGGSMFVVGERNGAYTSDEAYKMAYTDAISVACKMLGFGSDIYWQAGRSKYTTEQPQTTDSIPQHIQNLMETMNNKVKGGMSKAEVLAQLKTFNSAKEFSKYNEEEAKKAIEFLNS